VLPCSTTESTLLPNVEGTKLSARNIYYLWDQVEPTVEKQMNLGWWLCSVLHKNHSAPRDLERDFERTLIYVLP
jgi:hypothetical protein